MPVARSTLRAARSRCTHLWLASCSIPQATSAQKRCFSYLQKKEPATHFGWVFFLISSAHLHVRPRWGVRADEQTENKLTTINLTLVQKARFTYSVKGQPSAARFWSAAWSSPCSA